MYPEIHMESGLDAFVLNDDNNIVIAFRGTEFSNLRGWRTDVPNDLYILKNKIPQQAMEADQLCRWIKEQYPNENIIVTGHSLGAGIGTYGAAKNGLAAVVFNPIGTAGLIKSYEYVDTSKIINYCNPKDWVPAGNANEHLGQCYEIPSKSFSKDNYKDQHLLENMEDLQYRKPITKEELSRKYKEYRESIPSYMDTAIDAFKETFGINKLHQVLSRCPGKYQVSGYTRSDGKKVDSYVRSCGAHH